jgi:hypothetical protein
MHGALGIDREVFDDEYTGWDGRYVSRQNSGSALPPSLAFDRYISCTRVPYRDPHRSEVDHKTII